MSERLLLKDVVLNGVPCEILISGGRITEIGRGIGSASDDVIDCMGMTAMPAFVNMHTHSGMTLFRGMAGDCPLHEWLDRVWKAEALMGPEIFYWGTKLACVEMIKSGTACFADMYWDIDRTCEAVRESGMRALLTYCFLDGGDMDKAARQREECGRMYALSLEWPDRMKFGVSIHAHYTVCDANMLWAAAFAREHGLLLQTHLSETVKENEEHYARYGMSPTLRLESMGILGKNLIAAHCLWLDDADVDALGRHGVTAVHNINSNLKLSSGYRFRYRELKAAGANLTIGTDGSGSSDSLDVREALKTAALVQKAWRGDPSAMPVGELMAMATVNAGKALGTSAGLIEKGAPADIMLIDTSSPAFIPCYDIAANLVYSANSSSVDTLICDGRVLMYRRRIEGEDVLLEKARTEINRFFTSNRIWTTE